MNRFGWIGYFLWVPAFATLISIGALAIRVQVIFAYEYGGGHGYAGLQGRTYTSCTYVGLSGAATVSAAAGRCSWLRFPPIGGT